MDDLFYDKTGATTAQFASLNQFAIDNYGMSISQADAIFDQFVNGTKGTRCF